MKNSVKNFFSVKKRWNRISKFKRFLLLYILIFLCVIALALTVLFNFVKQYELSRPDSAAQEYLDGDIEKEWHQLISDTFEIPVTQYESRDKVIDNCFLQYVYNGTLSCARDYTQGAQSYIYTVYSGKDIVGTMQLEPSGKTKLFGFKLWEAHLVSVEKEAFKSCVSKDIIVEIPAKASLTLNGFDIDTSNGEKSYWSGVSEFEKTNVENYPTLLITFKDMYLPPVIYSELENEKLTVSITETGYCCAYPTIYKDGLVLTVPSQATVKINNVQLDESYITKQDIKYSDMGEFDKASEEQITRVRYTINGLCSEPDVMVSIDGTVISESDEEGVYKLPASLKHNVTIQVPDGAVVKVNGIELSDDFIVSENDHYSFLSEYERYMKDVPTRITYLVPELYNVPTVTAYDTDGNSLLEDIADDAEQGKSDWFGFLPLADENAEKKYETMVKKFINDYVAYTTGGYKNLESNLENVLSWMIKGTEVYSRVNISKSSLSYSGGYSSYEIENFETSDYSQINDNCFSCVATADICTVANEKEGKYESSYLLFFVYTGNEWKICRMQTLK